MYCELGLMAAVVLSGLWGCVGAAHRPEGLKRFDAGEYPIAAGWLKKEAADGDFEATIDLGYMAQYGVGVPKNETAAEQLFQHAMSHGSVRAETCLAVLYLQGSVVPHDYPKALELLKDADGKGDVRADYDLSLVYTLGLGVPVDKEEGKRWTMKVGYDDDMQRYVGTIRGLIYENVRYPPAAATTGGYDGSAEVQFSIENLRATNATIFRSSGHDDLDVAALAAVSKPSFPPPPVGITQPISYFVVVNFTH